jgi:hypothetical protein
MKDAHPYSGPPFSQLLDAVEERLESIAGTVG